MIRTFNTLDNIDNIFDEGSFNIDKWETYINSFLNNKSYLFKDELEEYIISGQYNYEDDFLPILNNVYHNEKINQVINNFNNVISNINDKVNKHFKSLDVDIYLYLGLLNGAGWALEIDNKQVILLGIEKY